MAESVPSRPITPLAQDLMAFAMVGHFVIKGPLWVGNLSLLSLIVSHIDCISHWSPAMDKLTEGKGKLKEG